jgi:hypothetical protein
MTLDHSLIAEAEGVAGRLVHDVNGLIHRYKLSFEYLTEEQCEQCERDLRAFVSKYRIDRALKKYREK